MDVFGTLPGALLSQIKKVMSKLQTGLENMPAYRLNSRQLFYLIPNPV